MKNNQNGSILVTALLFTVAIMLVGVAAMWTSNSSTKISGNISRRQEAIRAAEAGLARGQWVLVNTANWQNLLNGTPCTAAFTAGKGRVLCDPTSNPLQDSSGNDISILQSVPVITGATMTSSALTNMENITYTTYIRNDDDEEADNGGTQTDLDRRLIIRSEGIARDGLSYVALEMIVNASWLADIYEKSYSSEGMGKGGGGSVQASQ